MARIRSTLPGQWTDEEFVGMSPLARLLTIAIRNEADDQGLFEWKPVTIKMRLMPVDNVDIGELLAEMEAHNQVRRFEHGGRQYGAIRNFRRFQRPKKPNCTHVLPDELRTYVGLKDGGSEPADDDGDAVPQKSEPAPQREEVGGSSRRRRKEDTAADARVTALADQVCEAAGADSTTHANWHMVETAVARWRGSGCTDEDILAGVRTAAAKRTAAGKGPPNSPAFFDGAVADAKAARLRPMPAGSARSERQQEAPPDTAAMGDDIASRLRAWRSLVYDLDPTASARIKAEITGVRSEAAKARALMAELGITEADVDGRRVPDHLRRAA